MSLDLKVSCIHFVVIVVMRDFTNSTSDFEYGIKKCRDGLSCKVFEPLELLVGVFICRLSKNSRFIHVTN